MCFFFFFKQKTAYEMRISDWSSDVCSSDLSAHPPMHRQDSTRSSWQQARLSNEPWPYHPLQNVVYYRYYGRDWGSEPAAIPCKHFNITSRSYRKVFYVSARKAPSCAYRRTIDRKSTRLNSSH